MTLSSKRSLWLHRKRRHVKEWRAEAELDPTLQAEPVEEEKSRLTKRGKPRFKRLYRCKFCSVS
jgi:hypothetical protein